MLISFADLCFFSMLNVCRAGKGSNPEWKETFLFDVSSNDCMELRVKIMDSDGGVGADDFVGHTRLVVYFNLVANKRK